MTPTPTFNVGDPVVVRARELGTVLAVRPSNDHVGLFTYVYYVVLVNGSTVGPLFSSELRLPTEPVLVRPCAPQK